MAAQGGAGGISALGWIGGGVVLAGAVAAGVYFSGLLRPEPTEPVQAVSVPDESAQPPAQDPAPQSPETSEDIAAVAPEPEAEAQAEPEPAATTPEPALPELLAPSFDLVRVEPDGTAVIAGKATPAATVTLLVDGDDSDSLSVDGSGSFVMFASLPASTAPRVLTLRARLGDRETLSVDEIILAPSPATPAPEVASVVPEPAAPDASETPADAMNPQPDKTTAEPEQVAEAEPAPAEPEQVAEAEPTPAEPEQVAEAEPTPAEPEQVAEAEPAPAEPEQAAEAEPAPAAPERVAEAEPTPAEPEQVAEAEPTPAEPEQVAEAEPAPAEPEQVAEAEPAPAAPEQGTEPEPAPAEPERVAEAEPAPAEPETQPEPAATTPQPAADADTADTAPQPADDAGQEVAAATPDQPGTDPTAGAPAPQAPAESPAAPVAPQQTDDTAAVTPAPAPAPVAVIRSGAEGVELVQPAAPTPPEMREKISLETIGYNDAGDVLLSGRTRPGAVVRVYLNNRSVTDLASQADGRWNGRLAGIAPGIYTLRLDALDPGGKVLGRIETPFKREAPEVLQAQTAPKTQGDTIDDTPPIRAITVQKGDTLWAISRDRYGEPLLYVKVFEANRDQIRDPDLIYPGQVFTMPDVSE